VAEVPAEPAARAQAAGEAQASEVGWEQQPVAAEAEAAERGVQAAAPVDREVKAEARLRGR
jgi:hypothetical protein